MNYAYLYEENIKLLNIYSEPVNHALVKLLLAFSYNLECEKFVQSILPDLPNSDQLQNTVSAKWHNYEGMDVNIF